MAEKRITHLSLFAGIGGLDIAAHWAGIETVAWCEWAAYPRRVLKAAFPGLPNWRDIRELTAEDFHAKTGLSTVDIVSGGFPCQPFSAAGQRRGREDDRYLWPEMCRVVSEIRPTWVIGENVAGLLSMAEPCGAAEVVERTLARLPEIDHYEAVHIQPEKMLLGNILEDLEDIGYDVQPFAFPAAGVDALHKRERICIVAHAHQPRA